MIALDRRVESWIVAHRIAPLDRLFVALSWVGAYGLVWLALGAAVALVLRRPRVFVLVLAADLAAYVLSSGLKELVRRPRPDPAHRLREAAGFSFPSGHATIAFACCVVLSFAVPRLWPVFAILACAIAFSRLYLGVHYPLDALGGAALGVAVATALLLPGRVRRRWRELPPPG
ncbi:MAG: phosphatase PAP2 family protein [Candidatus Rokuibacteriota bacterium]|nr:MAG: phosphatase PAP2 family protein [Candidatus Rokubacteria bacterium]